MKRVSISTEINEEHPTYQWAKKQSDSVNAFGHIGTHIDCYTKKPTKAEYNIQAVIIDCSTTMPTIESINKLNLRNKALVLYTSNLEVNGYGNKDYGAKFTSLDSDVLNAILKQLPSFIVIDSYGIGAHGDQHISYDKRCEQQGCFVIENVALTEEMLTSLTALEIFIELKGDSTGKRCEVIALLEC